MSYLLEHSNIPEKRQRPVSLTPDECDYDAFCELADVKSNIKQFVDDGSNLYIYSKVTGNGKTSWAIKLLLKYFDVIWPGSEFRPRGLFVNVPTFLAQLKDFNTVDSKFEELKHNLVSADLVVWDDIASTNMSSYDHAQLLNFIDQRCLGSKSNIFTGNLNAQELDKLLGVRLRSRVWNTSKTIQLFGGDKR